MDEIYIEATENGELFSVPLESAIVIVLFKYFKCFKKISLKKTIIRNYIRPTEIFLKFKPEFLIEVQKSDDLKLNNNLQPPFYIHNKNHFISGFSAVCREIIITSGSEEFDYLLGFNKSCLQSPTESSSWTKFCEIGIANAFNEIIEHHLNPCNHIFELPNEFIQFENHLKKPLKINDKYRKEIEKSKKGIIEKDLKFSEYHHPTLVDVLLFLCFQLSLEFFPENVKSRIFENFPLLLKWNEDMKNYDKNLFLILEHAISLLYKPEIKPKFEQLYFFKKTSQEIFSKDCGRYKQINKNANIETNVTNSLQKLKMNNIEISSHSKFITNCSFDWEAVPCEIHPDYGGVPSSRLQRKKEQLKYIVDIVTSLVKHNEIIVDFCCGSGHLGIILATLLPNCKVIFLESKQFSLLNIKKRSLKLKLQNCLFYQSNIDYFIGNFDIGISLHACGTATDIVLRKCLQKRAKFVCCPCCYGSINPMPHVSYPLSKIYKNIISENDYLYLTHTADLSINFENEIHCMDVIDTDRKLFTEEANYKCILSKLSPESCTPKNRLLIGVPK